MAKVNSNTQMLKQAGNGITVTVLMAIFSQLNIKGVKPWNEMSQEERERLIHQLEILTRKKIHSVPQSPSNNSSNSRKVSSRCGTNDTE